MGDALPHHAPQTERHQQDREGRPARSIATRIGTMRTVRTVTYRQQCARRSNRGVSRNQTEEITWSPDTVHIDEG